MTRDGEPLMAGLRRRWAWVAGGVVIAAAAAVGFVVALRAIAPAPVPPVTVARPAGDGVLASYLPDGEPIWVIGHEDGSASVLSGFDTHTPYGMGKLLWWCPLSRTLTNPHTGTHYDEFGVKFGGPAPAGLPGWEVRAEGSRLLLGDPIPGAPIGSLVHGDPAPSRRYCSGADPITVHTFTGWRAWRSPSALLAAAPSGWSLLDAVLQPAVDGPILCAQPTCDDWAPTAGVEYPPADRSQFLAPWPETQWIVRVQGGRLVDLTRTVRAADFVFH